MSFDPIDNQWRKLLKKSSEEKVFLSLTGADFEERMYMAPISEPLIAEKKYTVTVSDGDATFNSEFITKAITVDAFGDIVYIGNLGIMDGEEDTGEILLAFTGVNPEDNQLMIVVGLHSNSNVQQTSRFTITTTETIQTIDPKYISGVTLPLVELTAEPTSEGTALTEAENAALNSAAAKNLPIVVRFTAETGLVNAVFNYAAGSFLWELQGGMNMLADVGGGSWIFMSVLPT